IGLDECPEFQGLVPREAEGPFQTTPIVLRFDVGVERAIHCTLHLDLIREVFAIAELRIGQKGCRFQCGMGCLQNEHENSYAESSSPSNSKLAEKLFLPSWIT